MRQIKNQANSDHRCPLQRGKNHNLSSHLAYNIDEIREISQYSK